ncbi:hypothetical protein EMPG_16035 [Blastomyces silverae]|uniref:Uncharacterized protein n=1 Tax=Blastomyces silverae TaxID=2060906 RepID=A0A0H1BBY4_9EURO|nr:hypothetical protein EMPG_16035 [Blastomyces silverae]
MDQSVAVLGSSGYFERKHGGGKYIAYAYMRIWSWIGWHDISRNDADVDIYTNAIPRRRGRRSENGRNKRKSTPTSRTPKPSRPTNIYSSSLPWNTTPTEK